MSDISSIELIPDEERCKRRPRAPVQEEELPNDSGFEPTDECPTVEIELKPDGTPVITKVGIERCDSSKEYEYLEDLAFCTGRTIYYIADRIGWWTSLLTQRVLGRIVTGYIGKPHGTRLTKFHEYLEEVGKFERQLMEKTMELIAEHFSWVFQEVAVTTLLYLQTHMRSHCTAYKDEGLATAWGLYWTLKNHVFSPAVLKTLENIEFGLKSSSSREQSGYVYYHDPLAFVVRYLAVYEVANYHYQMPEYRKFVKYLKAPLARPEVYIIKEPSVLAFVRGDVFSGISIKIAPEKLPYTLLIHTYPYRSSIEIEVEKRESKFEYELRPKYLGKEPKSISGDIIEVWGMCHRRLELEAGGLIPINYEDLWPQYRLRKI